jgi:urea transport system substrate-binding protein
MTSPHFRSWNRRQFTQFASFAGLGLVADRLAGTPVQSAIAASPKTIRVGVLHSLSGTMAISEKIAVDAEMLAIEEINQSGGVLGQQIEVVIEDGESDWSIFNQKAKKLIDRDRVATIFGGWTSASRKSMLPTIEDNNILLWYPLVYEGMECSPNIFYAGAVPNQQVEPSLRWLLSQKSRNFYLIGSDYVYPRTINVIIKSRLNEWSGNLTGEDYLPLGDLDVAECIQKIKQALPTGGVIYNSLNGDSNVAFFVQSQRAGLSPSRYPVMSVNIGEEEVLEIGSDYLTGHYLAQSYFQTVKTTANRKFVAAFKAKYGDKRLTNDPAANAYTMVYLWKQAVEAAGDAYNTDKVRQAAIGQTFAAPEGKVTIDSSQHLWKASRVGQVKADGSVAIVHESAQPIRPQTWNAAVSDVVGRKCNWAAK